MEASIAKRAIGLAIGFIFAFVYGFFTMLATGGGHGNVLWFLLFLYAGLYGFYYPLIGFVIPDMRPFWARAIAVSLVVANLSISVIVIIWAVIIQDIQKSWRRDSTVFIFLAVVHFGPLVVIAINVISRSLIEKETDDPTDGPISILK